MLGVWDSVHAGLFLQGIALVSYIPLLYISPQCFFPSIDQSVPLLVYFLSYLRSKAKTSD